VARETILADKPSNGSSTADLSRFEPKKSPAMPATRPPSMYLGKSKETLDITMGGTLESEDSVQKEVMPDPSSSSGDNAGDSTKGPEETPAEIKLPAPDPDARPATSSGWLGGWLSRPTVPSSGVPENPSQDLKNPEQPPIGVVENPQSEQSEHQEPVAAMPEDATKSNPAPTASSSWFGLWSTAATTIPSEGPKEEIPVQLKETDQDVVMEDAPVTEQPVKPVAGSTWAFWSTEPRKKTVEAPTQPEPGQLAVTGEPSQDHPEPAKAEPVKEVTKSKSSKRVRPQSMEIDDATPKTAQQDQASSKAAPSQSSAPAKVSPPNLLLPSVKSTYRLVENPSILQQIARLILYGQQQPVKHVFLVKEPPKIKKALAIGIHGLFPAPLLRTVIGQPTGTSIRFANHAAAAIRRWTDLHGSVDCEIEKVALEGEGKIAERVDNLWKLLLNWIDHVRKADFILLACHSQGVPVALMLVAKLIEFGVVSTGKIGICAMGKSYPCSEVA
jgi:hypothetical protein